MCRVTTFWTLSSVLAPEPMGESWSVIDNCSPTVGTTYRTLSATSTSGVSRRASAVCWLWTEGTEQHWTLDLMMRHHWLAGRARSSGGCGLTMRSSPWPARQTSTTTPTLTVLLAVEPASSLQVCLHHRPQSQPPPLLLPHRKPC